MRNTLWSRNRGLAVAPALRRRAREGLRAVAAWAVRNQVRHEWPRWDANQGRFPYHVHLRSNDNFLSTSWNTARTVQGLYSASQALGDRECRAAAERGLEYVKSLQIFAPEFPEARGAFLAETPQSRHVGPRDGIECAQALMVQALTTGDRASLHRVGVFLEWMERLMDEFGPEVSHMFIRPGWKAAGAHANTAFTRSTVAIPAVQYAVATGRKRFVARLAVPLGELLLDRFQQGDGVFRMLKPGERHHAPGDDGVVYNDDGNGIALLCLHRATGRRKFLDGAVLLGEWWLRQDPAKPSDNCAAPASAALFLADLVRATGDARYLPFIEALAETIFDRQVPKGESPLTAGAFLGEDMAERYRPGSRPGEFVALRTTSYGLLALAKLAAAGAKRWGPAYSAFGY